ncbi:hypothetical protein [Geotalea sp. SG265]|uniref:hypothetical protein n=1 Tax=Geotalea sp. SG265 TaxID=2922867 RepID=UPI001FAEA377|nr:hypothetical protein [Geotalea sp. SG265]
MPTKMNKQSSHNSTNKSCYGYFQVNLHAVLNLLHNEATSAEVLAFLILSRYSFNGKSSASYSAIRRILGKSTKTARSLLERLQQMNYGNKPLIFDALPPREKSVWIYNDNGEFEEHVSTISYDQVKFKRKLTRWDTFKLRMDVDASFSNGFVDNSYGKSTFRNLLRYNNDILVRLLLLLHVFYDARYDLVHPVRLNYPYHIEPLFSKNNVLFYFVKESSNIQVDKFIINKLWHSDTSQSNVPYAKNQIAGLLKEMENLELLKKVVMIFIFDGEISKEPSGFYEIDIKTNKYEEKHSCHTLSTQLKSVVYDHGFIPGRKDYRFYHEYFVALPSSAEKFSIISGYRLNFAARNSKNLDVADGIRTRQMCRQQIMDLLQTFN